MLRKAKDQANRKKLASAFLNTDAISNDDYSYHDAWIQHEVILTSGKSFYQQELDTIALGATVFVYANLVGVVAAGTLLDDRSVVVTDPAKLVSAEPLEYQRKVSWFADIARNPVDYQTVIHLCGTPSRAVRSIIKGRDALLNLVAAHAREADIAALEAAYVDNPTDARKWTLTRLCQGKYRDELLALWDDRCAVTGCSLSHVLRASHAIPWCSSSNVQRQDPNNGLPLVATLDALFDRGLISFADDGRMLCSTALTAADRQLLGVPAPLRKPLSDAQKAYLRAHRERFPLLMPESTTTDTR
jgi:putative restriction endonuclease